MEAVLFKTSPSFSPSSSSSFFNSCSKWLPRFSAGANLNSNGYTLRNSTSLSPFSNFRSLQISAAAATGISTKQRVDESESLTLDSIRYSLVRQEDSIIFSLLERSQYCYNAEAYDPNAFLLDGFGGALVEYMLKETEKLHAQVGRYKSPDEHPFFPDYLPDAILPPLQYPQVLSKRIHYGKFVAEAKFRASPEIYTPAIKAQDKDQLMNLLTYQTVEDAVKRRVGVKAKTFGQEVPVNQIVDVIEPVYKIKPDIVADLYGDWIMPLTKEVQVQYLLRRLD